MGNLLGCYVMPHPPIIIPEVGRGEEKKAAGTVEGCKKVAEEIRKLGPGAIVLITPHGPLFRDAVAISKVSVLRGNLGRFGVPNVKLEINVDMDLTEKIIGYAKVEGIMVALITSNSMKEYNISSELDHGAMVPLYFINQEYSDYKLVHITYGMLPKIDLYRFGMVIKRVIQESNENAVIIASGDLSHKLSDDGPYEYDPSGEIFDRDIIMLLSKGDVERVFALDKKVVDAAGECGLRSFYTMLGALDGYNIKGNLLSYEGPFGVGYGVMSFDLKESGDESYIEKLINLRGKERDSRRANEDPLVRLARESLEYYVKEGKHIKIPAYVTEDILNQKRGAFVSLKIEGELRGCIGTIFPATENLAEEIIRNAIEAGERDPRFYPVEEGELEDIEYSVDVLMPPEKADKNELDPKKYGVIVRKGSRAGLLLPDLEGVDTVDKQLSIALQKAGIDKDEEYTIEKFEVIRHR